MTVPFAIDFLATESPQQHIAISRDIFFMDTSRRIAVKLSAGHHQVALRSSKASPTELGEGFTLW